MCSVKLCSHLLQKTKSWSLRSFISFGAVIVDWKNCDDLIVIVLTLCLEGVCAKLLKPSWNNDLSDGGNGRVKLRDCVTNSFPRNFLTPMNLYNFMIGTDVGSKGEEWCWSPCHQTSKVFQSNTSELEVIRLMVASVVQLLFERLFETRTCLFFITNKNWIKSASETTAKDHYTEPLQYTDRLQPWPEQLIGTGLAPICFCWLSKNKSPINLIQFTSQKSEKIEYKKLTIEVKLSNLISPLTIRIQLI